MAPGKSEFVEPRQSTQENFLLHTYFNTLEVIAGTAPNLY